MEELEQEDDRDHNMERSDGRVPQAYMQKNIAQSIPPHLRHQFTLATVACIRRFERDADQQMHGGECHRDDEGTITEDTARTCSQHQDHVHEDKHQELAEDALEQQKQINKILTKAVQFIRNGQQKEAIRELAKEELNTIADPKTKSEILALVHGQVVPPRGAK